jgi:hypothetical protein
MLCWNYTPQTWFSSPELLEGLKNLTESAIAVPYLTKFAKPDSEYPAVHSIGAWILQLNHLEYQAKLRPLCYGFPRNSAPPLASCVRPYSPKFSYIHQGFGYSSSLSSASSSSTLQWAGNRPSPASVSYLFLWQEMSLLLLLYGNGTLISASSALRRCLPAFSVWETVRLLGATLDKSQSSETQ